MLKKGLLLLLALTSVVKALEANIPFNVNLYESHIPAQLADQLILNSSPESEVFYERFFIDRKYQNGLDEYICEFAPVTLQPPSEEYQSPESDSEILAKATQLIHSSFSLDSCVWAYDFRGWYWTYAFCFGDKVIQYHEGAPISERPQKHLPIAPNTIFVLGRFTKASADKIEFKNQVSQSQFESYSEQAGRSYRLLDEKSSPFAHHSSQRVVLQMVTDGTLCDMTGQPRSLEMMYLCSENGGSSPQIMNVQEVKTCHYKMVLHVPKLCSYDPFIPNKHVQESLVDVACQKIDKEPVENAASNLDFGRYIGRTVLREDDDFPVRADNRVNIAQHEAQDLGHGFYVASNDYHYVSSSEYFNYRSVVFFNGEFEDLEDLNYQFGKTIFEAVGSSLLAPTATQEFPEVLDWMHKFVLWFEIYDFTGEFILLSRIENSADTDQHQLDASVVDPVDLLEMNGDIPLFVRFERPEFKAPSNMWNFELFSKDPRYPYSSRKRIIKHPQLSENDELPQNLEDSSDPQAEHDASEQEPQAEENHLSMTSADTTDTTVESEEMPELDLEETRDHDKEGDSHFVEVPDDDQLVLEYLDI
ncbi:hypothetical protein PUMCH_001021 [Australozyma saopauloensis]|uniref:Endoplasmic reticulum lectin n=1 Tax=Australozyma saopauloensis TaxID=291208 RepID=A0AAX4H7S0_9ASCO|nr:hypothetical protein PUMCH_001021 [[Candida] saopauloensis]